MNMPKVDVKAAEERKAEFCRVLGEFVLGFASIEREILGVLVLLSKVTRPVAMSVFSGLHIDNAKDYIKRIIAAEAAVGVTTDYTLLVSALDHLGKITRTRNDILHHGLEFWIDDDPLLHNRMKANTPDKLFEYRVSVHDLRSMVSDLDKIFDHLLVQFPPPGAQFSPHVIANTRKPWQYKPPVRSGPLSRPPGNAPRPRGQRKSSPE